MPIDNLAKVFGPTVIGYSSADPDHHAIFSETAIQKDVRKTVILVFLHLLMIFATLFQVMENLLKLSTEYWELTINPDSCGVTKRRYSFFGKV